MVPKLSSWNYREDRLENWDERILKDWIVYLPLWALSVFLTQRTLGSVGSCTKRTVLGSIEAPREPRHGQDRGEEEQWEGYEIHWLQSTLHYMTDWPVLCDQFIPVSYPHSQSNTQVINIVMLDIGRLRLNSSTSSTSWLLVYSLWVSYCIRIRVSLWMLVEGKKILLADYSERTNTILERRPKTFKFGWT